LFFHLEARSLHAMPADLRVFECAVRGPSGNVTDDDRIDTLGSMLVCRYDAETTPGTYEVRWYGSTRSRRFYEVTRATFDREQPATTNPRFY
jgi:hypothetical protein